MSDIPKYAFGDFNIYFTEGRPFIKYKYYSHPITGIGESGYEVTTFLDNVHSINSFDWILRFSNDPVGIPFAYKDSAPTGEPDPIDNQIISKTTSSNELKQNFSWYGGFNYKNNASDKSGVIHYDYNTLNLLAPNGKIWWSEDYPNAKIVHSASWRQLHLDLIPKNSVVTIANLGITQWFLDYKEPWNSIYHGPDDYNWNTDLTNIYVEEDDILKNSYNIEMDLYTNIHWLPDPGEGSHSDMLSLHYLMNNYFNEIYNIPKKDWTRLDFGSDVDEYLKLKITLPQIKNPGIYFFTKTYNKNSSEFNDEGVNKNRFGFVWTEASMGTTTFTPDPYYDPSSWDSIYDRRTILNVGEHVSPINNKGKDVLIENNQISSSWRQYIMGYINGTNTGVGWSWLHTASPSFEHAIEVLEKPDKPNATVTSGSASINIGNPKAPIDIVERITKPGNTEIISTIRSNTTNNYTHTKTNFSDTIGDIKWEYKLARTSKISETEVFKAHELYDIYDYGTDYNNQYTVYDFYGDSTELIPLDFNVLEGDHVRTIKPTVLLTRTYLHDSDWSDPIETVKFTKTLNGIVTYSLKHNNYISTEFNLNWDTSKNAYIKNFYRESSPAGSNYVRNLYVQYHLSNEPTIDPNNVTWTEHKVRGDNNDNNININITRENTDRIYLHYRLRYNKKANENIYSSVVTKMANYVDNDLIADLEIKEKTRTSIDSYRYNYDIKTKIQDGPNQTATIKFRTALSLDGGLSWVGSNTSEPNWSNWSDNISLTSDSNGYFKISNKSINITSLEAEVDYDILIKAELQYIELNGVIL